MLSIVSKNNNWVSTMDVNKCLPPELTVQSVEHILHRIGLTLDSTKSYPKRKLFFNPIIIFSFLLIFIIREVFVIVINEENDLIFKVMGTFGYLIGIRREMSICLFLFSNLSLSFQMIYYYNYRNCIKPTFLRVFQMMSGSVSPKSLGLSDEQQIRKLLKRTKSLVKFLDFHNNRVIPILALVFMLTLYSLKTNMNEGIFYGIPNALIFMIWINYSTSIVTFQHLILYILCSYLKLKFNSLNERLLEMKRRKRFIRIRETLQSFDSLFSEISEFNSTFFSKILLTTWSLLGVNIVFLLYVSLFSNLDPFNKILMSYALCFLISIFLFIIFTTSSVTYCANKSYKTLNSLIISYSKHNKHLFYSRISIFFKVNFFYTCIIFIHFTLIQTMNLA